jgi:hypothetical protein
MCVCVCVNENEKSDNLKPPKFTNFLYFVFLNAG